MGSACPAIWNVLHDAIVIGVSGEVPGDVVLTLECEYLRRRFADPGNTFALTLNQCTRLRFRPWADELGATVHKAAAVSRSALRERVFGSTPVRSSS